MKEEGLVAFLKQTTAWIGQTRYRQTVIKMDRFMEMRLFSSLSLLLLCERIIAFGSIRTDHTYTYIHTQALDEASPTSTRPSTSRAYRCNETSREHFTPLIRSLKNNLLRLIGLTHSFLIGYDR